MTTNAENIRARDTRVIAAAWRLIAREGVLALTVKALADEAGVAVSSMRYTMPSQAVRLHQGGAQAVVPGTLAETGSREDRAPPLHESEDYSGGDLLTHSGGRGTDERSGVS